MPAARYESPEVKTALTTEEVRQRYRDAALVIFKEQQLYRVRRPRESELELTTYLSFGVNRRVMAYSNNGNDPVIVHRNVTDAVTQANESSNRFSSQIFRIYNKPRESCSIS